MGSPLHVVRAGVGPPLLLIHGSAADHTTWSIQLASPLTRHVTLVAYDRRGSGRSPGEAGSVEDHAADAAALAADLGPVIVVGSSFGAVVALELVRRWPERVRGAVLCEPPLAPTDDAPPVPLELLARFDELAATEGGEAAAEHFLRTVLGDAAYERMPRMFQVRSKAMWRAIRSDSAALGAYRVRYAELGTVDVPVLLLGGARSAAYFRPTLEALAAALGRARLEILAGAGHMMQAEAHRAFAEAVAGFAGEVLGGAG
jgi:pimeloyl-ACP methyl ester carboxylesterase